MRRPFIWIISISFKLTKRSWSRNKRPQDENKDKNKSKENGSQTQKPKAKEEEEEEEKEEIEQESGEKESLRPGEKFDNANSMEDLDESSTTLQPRLKLIQANLAKLAHNFEHFVPYHEA